MIGPVHVAAEVIGTRKAGAYRQLTLVAPGVAERFRPGTFLAVSVGEASGAVAVQVGTALLHDPTTVARMIDDLTDDPLREPA